MSSKQGFAKPALLVLFLTGLLVATVSAVSIKNSVSTFAESATTEAAEKNTYQGLIAKISSKCTSTNNVLCYKLFLNDGKTAIWIKPKAAQELESIKNKLGNRVKVKVEEDAKEFGGTNYLIATKISPALIDSKFTLGLGGGWVGVGDPTTEDNGNGFWHNDLGIKSLAPGIYWSGDGGVQQTLEDAKASPPRFNESRFPDGDVTNCRDKGYRCTLVVDEDPDHWPTWIGSLHDLATDPVKLLYLQNFAEKMSSRYGTNVDAYVFLNEPDIKGVTPEDFAKIQTAFYTGIKKGNDKARVSIPQFATLQDTTTIHAQPTTDWMGKFLAKESEAPTGKFYDVMNIHHYKIFDFAWKGYDSYAQGGIRGIISWINNNTANGNRPVIISEIGSDAFTDPASEKIQAADVFKMLAQAHSMPNVEYLQWYILRDRCAGGPSNPGRCYNLVFPKSSGYYPETRKRPAYYAFKTINRELDGLKFLKVDESNSALIEGYVFTDSNLNTKKEVIWKRPGSSGGSVLKTFKAPQIRVINTDGTEKKVSGPSGIQVTDQPVIVDFSQEALD